MRINNPPAYAKGRQRYAKHPDSGIFLAAFLLPLLHCANCQKNSQEGGKIHVYVNVPRHMLMVNID